MINGERVIIEHSSSLKDKVGYVYALTIPELKAVKFGVTNGTVEDRVQALQTGCPLEITPLAVHLCEFSYGLEKAIHTTFAQNHMRLEWFRRDMLTDLFIWMNFRKILNAHLLPEEVTKFNPSTIRGVTVNQMFGDVINYFNSPYIERQPQQNLKPLNRGQLTAILNEINVGI